MFWGIILFIIFIIALCSPGTTNKSKTSNRSRSLNLSKNNHAVTKAVDVQVNKEVQVNKDLQDDLYIIQQEETYEEKHERINKAIAAGKKLNEELKKDLEKKEIIEQSKENNSLNNKGLIVKESVSIIPISDLNYVSTTKLAKIYGVSAKPELFKFFTDKGYIEYEDKKYLLTSLGAEFGGYKISEKDGGRFIVWEINKIFPIMLEFVEIKLTAFESLYHLTHIENLSGILSKNLYCHSKMNNYIDVSNHDVNGRRQKLEPCYGKAIHDYVPFYFNIKNAMLYAVQKQAGKNVIVLEFDKKIACLPHTIFSDRNAATNNVNFITLKEDINKFSWDEIYANSWSDNRIINNTRKQFMMAECLVFQTVSTEFLKKIHCQNEEIFRKILFLVRENSLNIEVAVSRDVFF